MIETEILNLPYNSRRSVELLSVEEALSNLTYGVKVLYGEKLKKLVVYPHENERELLVL